MDRVVAELSIQRYISVLLGGIVERGDWGKYPPRRAGGLSL
jgi:hypothetical protein